MKNTNAFKQLAVRMVNLPAAIKAGMAMTADAGTLLGVAALTFAILPDEAQRTSLPGVPIWLMAPIAALIGLQISRAYNMITRYAGMSLLWCLARGLILGPGSLMILAVLLDQDHAWRYYLVFGCIAFAALVTLRIAAAAWLRPNSAVRHHADRVLIYGAGEAGAQLTVGLKLGGGYRPIGFVDDRRDKQRRTLMGLPVYSSDSLTELKRADGFDQILLAIPSLTRARRQAILQKLESLAVRVKVMPSLDDLTDEGSLVDELRPVQIDDLLGRDPVTPDKQLMDACIRQRVVMITGAGGSIGAELARKVLKRGVSRIILLDNCEYALYEIDRELRDKISGVTPPPVIVPVLASVLDRQAMTGVIREHKVQTVYHAAAYKHVPLVEANALVGIYNNVIGTLTVARAAAEQGVEHFVQVSTDKAVRPTSVMGASKRVAELVVQSQAERNPHMRVAIVRFGNVLASSGSVVPLFQEQLAKGSQITVTHPEVTRYFMTIREAAQLVIQAGAMGNHGDVFHLEMGQPVRIVDLAHRYIHLSGLQVKDQNTPDGDVEIVFTGLRPGEKLYEELLIDANAVVTSHPRIYRANDGVLHAATRDRALAEIERRVLSEQCDVKAIVELVHNLAAQPAMRPVTSTPDDLSKSVLKIASNVGV